MKILRDVYEEMKAFLSRTPVEAGGIFGMRNGAVCRFMAEGHTSALEYRPNVSFLNAAIAEWAREGIAFAGIAHSHPNGVLRLSRGDVGYAEAIVAANPQMRQLYFAVAAQRDGAWELVFYNCLRKKAMIGAGKAAASGGLAPEEIVYYG